MTTSHGHFKAGLRIGAIPQQPAGNTAIAQMLADFGISIFPLDQRKRPLTPRGFHDARCDSTHWLSQPEALIGIPTADFWVLDLDPPVDANVQALCMRLHWEWQDLTTRCGLIAETPRGGFHLYWKRTPGVAVRTVANDIAVGIDTRGHDRDGNPTGFIVAPGCMLRDGRRYTVQSGSFEDLSVAPPRLLSLASFSRSEYARIAADPGLGASMRSAEPSAWRDIFDAHIVAERTQLPPLTSHDAEPMRRQALDDLDAERHRLSQLSDGRRMAVFMAAARLARYAANGVLTVQEIETGLLAAWVAAGKCDLDYPRGAIRRALEKGRNDPLPPLARRFRILDGSAGR